MSKPLQGVRVLDLTHVVAGPLVSFYLAQMGAEVIKIEPPLGGEVMRASKDPAEADTPTGFVAMNAGKRSLAVDIRTPEGAGIVRDLARTADVFMENFRPGVVAKYGLDHNSIRSVKSDIVYCSISAFGQSGEWSRRSAYDHVVQALTGMMMMSGGNENAPPLKVGFPVVDVAVGMLGALAVVGALHRRSVEGKGQFIDASMVQASLMLMYTYSSAYLTSGAKPQRIGNRGYSGSPGADTYRCADGWLSTAANTPAQFRKMSTILGLEALCSDSRALDLDAFNSPGGGFVIAKDLEYLRTRFNEAFASQSAGDMEERLNAVGVSAAKVRRLGEFLEEAQSGKVDLPDFRFDQGGRIVRTAGLGFQFADDGHASDMAAERLGQSGRELLRELGIPDERIDQFASAGIVKL